GDHLPGDQVVADAEMLQGALRLRPPELVGRHVDRTEAVLFDTSSGHGRSFRAGVPDAGGIKRCRAESSCFGGLGWILQEGCREGESGIAVAPEPLKPMADALRPISRFSETSSCPRSSASSMIWANTARQNTAAQ